jgi:hypothetical protein
VARKGLNCTLSFVNGKTKRTYRIRAGNLGYGVQMVSGESAARIHRAYYPHKTANQQFSVQVLLKDWAERNDFINWLSSYAQWALDPNVVRGSFPVMTVQVPSRDFYQRGMPLQGYEWGAHTGMMMFTPVIMFEAAYSPGQLNVSPETSTVINKWSAFASDPAIRYFYPFGTQLEGDAVPTDYSRVVPPPPIPASPPPPGGGIFPTPTGAPPPPPPLVGG